MNYYQIQNALFKKFWNGFILIRVQSDKILQRIELLDQLDIFFVGLLKENDILFICGFI